MLQLPVPPVARLDPQVLNTVLIDLLTYRGNPFQRGSRDHSPILIGPDKHLPAFLRFDPQPIRWQPESDEWHLKFVRATVKSSTLAAFNTAVHHLDTRFRVHDIADPHFCPTDPRVLLPGQNPPKNDEKNVAPASFMAERSVRAWPPGYSEDRRLAVVLLYVPWSMHHCNGTLVLENKRGRTDESWAVLVREYSYYV